MEHHVVVSEPLRHPPAGAAGESKHLLGHVRPDDPALRPDQTGSDEALHSRSRAEVEHDLSLLEIGGEDGAATPVGAGDYVLRYVREQTRVDVDRLTDFGLRLPRSLAVVVANLRPRFGDHVLNQDTVGVNEVHLVCPAVRHPGFDRTAVPVLPHHVIDNRTGRGRADQPAALCDRLVDDLTRDGPVERQVGVQGSFFVSVGGEVSLLGIAAPVQEDPWIAVDAVALDDCARAAVSEHLGVQPDVLQGGRLQRAARLGVDADQTGGGEDAAIAVDGDAVPTRIGQVVLDVGIAVHHTPRVLQVVDDQADGLRMAVQVADGAEQSPHASPWHAAASLAHVLPHQV